MKRIYIFLLIFLIQNTALAQYGIQRKVWTPSFSSIGEYRSYEKDTGEATQKISQFSSPMIFKLPVTRNLAFDLATSFISSSADDFSLSGMSDVKARAVAILLDDSLMLSAGINLPSGKNQLDLEETTASLLLSDKAMGFRYNKLGEGLDINAGGGIARAFGPATIGAGAGYTIKGEYKYFKDKDVKYKPGNQLNVTGGLDILFKPFLLRSDVTYTSYQSDKSDGSEIFKEGPRLSIEETAVLTMDKLAILLSGAYTNRGESELIYTGEARKFYGAEIDINGLINIQLTKSFSLKLLADSTFIGKNDNDVNDAAVFGFGGGISLKFMKESFLDITGKYHTGSSNGGDVKLKGFSTTTALKLVF